MMDITHASILITSAWASTSGRAKPVMTVTEVTNRPKSTAPEPSSEAKESSPRQCPKIEFGSGARTNVKATRSGSQFCHRAHERMIRRNPTARKNDKNMTVRRPAVYAMVNQGGLVAVPERCVDSQQISQMIPTFRCLYVSSRNSTQSKFSLVTLATGRGLKQCSKTNRA